MRVVSFFDGAQSETTPTIGNIVASGLVQYADDATYEANEQGSPAEGNIYFNTTSNLIRYYNGASWINVVDENTAQTLTNKTMDGDLNTFQDISLTSLKTILADANKFIVRNGSGAVVSFKSVPAGDVVGTTDSQVLTNKTIDADLNTLSNIDNADIKSGAAIDATKIGPGSVSNTEFGYLDGVTSSIQTQFTGKQSTSEKGQVNGYASLDGGGKVPVTQLPSTVMTLEGQWNASINSPTLSDGTGDPGQIYETTVAGTVNFGNGPYTFAVGDWAVYGNDGKWYKSINSNQVNSVAGKVGTVTLVLDDMTDVTISAPTNNQVLKYNGSQWINSAAPATVSTLDDLTDVIITSPVTGQKIQYNGTSWVNVTDNLDSLSDVVISSPTNTQVLRYNGTNWVNDTQSSVLNVVSKTANYTTLTTDDVILVNSSGGAFTITLYTAVGNTGKVIRLIKTNSTNKVTVDGNASETIGTTLTVDLFLQDDDIVLVSDGANWQYVSKKFTPFSLKYRNVAGTSITNTLVPVPYTTLVYDNTQSAWVTNIFTAPRLGKYRVTIAGRFASGSFTAGSSANTRFRKNGTLSDFISVVEKQTSFTAPFSFGTGSTTVDLAAGDTLDIQIVSNEGTSRTLDTTPGINYIIIEEIM